MFLAPLESKAYFGVGLKWQKTLDCLINSKSGPINMYFSNLITIGKWVYRLPNLVSRVYPNVFV